MSARDDYPFMTRADPVEERFDQHWAICDEIDRLRVDNAVYANDVMPRLLRRNQLVAAQDDLIRELTRHADAMRGDLDDALTALADEGRDWPRTTIDAYDEFVKEC